MIIKHLGSKFEYERERKSELYSAYKRLLDEMQQIGCDLLYKRLVKMPCSRYWVSEERAAIVVSRIFKGDMLLFMQPLRRRMFFAIAERAYMLLQYDNRLTVRRAVFKAVRERAEEFYLTEGTARVMICRIKQEERRRRMRK